MYNVDLFYSNINSNIMYRRNMKLKANSKTEVMSNLHILFKNFDYEVVKINKVIQ